jgi:hypothetical protein
VPACCSHVNKIECRQCIKLRRTAGACPQIQPMPISICSA